MFDDDDNDDDNDDDDGEGSSLTIALDEGEQSLLEANNEFGDSLVEVESPLQ